VDKPLVIVESPAKARTVERFLGGRARVAASLGHVRDLPRSRLGVRIQEGFRPEYVDIPEKRTVVKELRQKAKKASRVLLATDPDREGEAISWHLAELLGLDVREPIRLEFHEITSSAVEKAFSQPRPIDMRLVEAQQARRVLDRLVGYQLSPFLWKKVRRGLSAGRVQSVALRLVCEREEEIRSHEPREYWTLEVELETEEGSRFRARYVGDVASGEKRELASEAAVREVVDTLPGEFTVLAVRRREKRRQPPAPFVTSVLLREASRKLGFGVARTMRLAQELYEGIEVPGEGLVGLITYMRTDSTRISDLAREEARNYIFSRWGEKFAGAGKPPRTAKKAGVQDAHEAIRPTSVLREPDRIREALTPEQYKLYRLIWERFLASQMAPAVYDTVSADLGAGAHLFRASGSRVVFPGFLSLYEESEEREGEGEEEEEGKELLPPLREGQQVALRETHPEQHFTQPPPRYSEAALVKVLEENGIGRPSTYAPIISTLQERGYVEKENGRLRPTELGEAVNRLLCQHFPEVVDTGFTARMEESLDRVEEGELPWQKVVGDFYSSFSPLLAEAERKVERVRLPARVTDEPCPQCGRPMVVRHGRFGPFLSCPDYPSCRGTKPYREKVAACCPDCGGALLERRGKSRRFYGCENYPRCRFVSWSRPEGNCPRCGGVMVARRSRGGEERLRCTNRDCGHEVERAKELEHAPG